jgi:hypothetical protein
MTSDDIMQWMVEAGNTLDRNFPRVSAEIPVALAGDDKEYRGFAKPLGLVAEALAEALAGATSWKEQPFYFWPGVQGARHDVRIARYMSDPWREQLAGAGYPVVPGLPIAEGIAVPVSPAMDRIAIYFDAALSPTTTPSSSDFSVGGTHNWLLVSQSDSRRHSLVAYIRGACDPPSAQGEGISVVPLRGSEWWRWGENIATWIKRESPGNPVWPYPYAIPGETPEAHLKRISRADEVESDMCRLRQDLYSLWLASFLMPPDLFTKEIRDRVRWTGDLLGRLREVDPHRATRVDALLRLERNAAVSLSPHYYGAWSALSFPGAPMSPAPDFAMPREIGSAMLFTQQLPEREQLLLIRRWLVGCYLLFRGTEMYTHVTSARRAWDRAVTERNLKNQYSHSMVSELTYISKLTSEVTSAASELFRFPPDIQSSAEAIASEISVLSDVAGEQPIDITVLEQAAVDAYREHGLHATDELRYLVGQAVTSVVTNPAVNAQIDRLVAIADKTLQETRAATEASAALMRMEEEIVRVSPGHGISVEAVVREAFIRAFTVFLDRARPLGSRPEPDYEKALARLCQPEERRAELAQSWTAFMKNVRFAPTSQQLHDWFTGHEVVDRLTLVLPPARCDVTLSGTEVAEDLLQLWLHELLLNALKHSAPAGAICAHIEVSCTTGPFALEVKNTVDHAALTRERDGHYGMEFLREAAARLFPYPFEVTLPQEGVVYDEWWEVRVSWAGNHERT